MDYIERTVVLTGVHAGQTINLRGKYPFKNGELVLSGTEHDVNCVIRSLERNFSAYLKGHPKIPTAHQPREPAKEANDGKRDLQPAGDADADGEDGVQGDVQPDGEGAAPAPSADGGVSAGAEAGTAGGVPDGNGQPEGVKALSEPSNEPAPKIDAKLNRAVMGLDRNNDQHWTADGKPAISAVAKLYGGTGFTRNDVEAAAPGFRRDSN